MRSRETKRGDEAVHIVETFRAIAARDQQLFGVKFVQAFPQTKDAGAPGTQERYRRRHRPLAKPWPPSQPRARLEACPRRMHTQTALDMHSPAQRCRYR